MVKKIETIPFRAFIFQNYNVLFLIPLQLRPFLFCLILSWYFDYKYDIIKSNCKYY